MARLLSARSRNALTWGFGADARARTGNLPITRRMGGIYSGYLQASRVQSQPPRGAFSTMVCRHFAPRPAPRAAGPPASSRRHRAPFVLREPARLRRHRPRVLPDDRRRRALRVRIQLRPLGWPGADAAGGSSSASSRITVCDADSATSTRPPGRSQLPSSVRRTSST
jgi:hypothetical protein